MLNVKMTHTEKVWPLDTKLVWSLLIRQKASACVIFFYNCSREGWLAYKTHLSFSSSTEIVASVRDCANFPFENVSSCTEFQILGQFVRKCLDWVIFNWLTLLTWKAKTRMLAVQVWWVVRARRWKSVCLAIKSLKNVQKQSLYQSVTLVSAALSNESHFRVRWLSRKCRLPLWVWTPTLTGRLFFFFFFFMPQK